MPAAMEPVEGNWYESMENGELFFVVTVDEEEGIIEVQYQDGATEEIELSAWEELDIEPAEQPDDFADRLEELDDEEEGGRYDREDLDGEGWGEPDRDGEV
ncbi:MAG: DUF6763 family protein [Thermodesulfobacteriota bacterium]